MQLKPLCDDIDWRLRIPWVVNASIVVAVKTHIVVFDGRTLSSRAPPLVYCDTFTSVNAGDILGKGNFYQVKTRLTSFVTVWQSTGQFSHIHTSAGHNGQWDWPALRPYIEDKECLAYRAYMWRTMSKKTELFSRKKAKAPEPPSVVPQGYQWSTQAYTLKDILRKFKLPCVVKCNVSSCSLLWENFSFDMRQPLMLFSVRKIRKVYARTLQVDPTSSQYVQYGPAIVIPEDYAGELI